MYIVDDPMLALIARFMADTENMEVSNTEFLHRQITAIEAYVEQFPHDERDARAMEWIAAHSKMYRRQWQKNTVARTLGETRCPDCPLKGGPQSSPCEIHGFWLKLLQQYIADEMSSQEYVESTLKLLDGYKNRLKAGPSRKRSPLETATLQLDPA